MSRIEKLSVALTAEMASTVRNAVDSGEYASSSEVIRDALREWKLRRMERERAVTELGRLWDEGVASGPAVDGPSAMKRVRGRLDAARKRARR